MKRITTTIKREFLAEIVAGSKTTEYRDVKPYWRKRLSGVTCPFELRLINGMRERAPEVTVLIDRIRESSATRQYHLHIGKVLRTSHWDKRRQVPK